MSLRRVNVVDGHLTLTDAGDPFAEFKTYLRLACTDRYDLSVGPAVHDPSTLNIVLGWHLLPKTVQHGMPERTVAWNTEQPGNWAWQEPPGWQRWWANSPADRANLANVGVKSSAHLSPVWPVSLHAWEPPDRVVFFGSMNARRQQVLEQVSARLRRPVEVVYEWGDRLVQAIAGQVILNVHYYDGAYCEIPRLMRAAEVGAVVVTEPLGDDRALFAGLLEAATPEGLATGCAVALCGKVEPVLPVGAGRVHERFQVALRTLPEHWFCTEG